LPDVISTNHQGLPLNDELITLWAKLKEGQERQKIQIDVKPILTIRVCEDII